MGNKYYKFNSNNYLTTLSAVPVLFEKAIKYNDWSEDGGRFIIHKLMFADYSDCLAFPIEFIVRDGNKLTDVIEMRAVSSFLISTKLRSLFEDNGLTGWQPYEVIVKRRDGRTIDGFSGFSVIGSNRINPTDPSFIPDFFRLKTDWNYIICSQKVVDVLKRNNIRVFKTELITDSNPLLYDQISFPK